MPVGHLYIPMFTAVLFTMAKMQKQPQCPLVDEWRKEMWSSHTTEYYAAFKKESLPFATTTRVDIKDIALSEINQTHEDMIPLTQGI